MLTRVCYHARAGHSGFGIKGGRMVGAIIACEVGFWIVLLAGLLCRYSFHRPRLGTALLLCVPLVDLALLVFILVDLTAGAIADWSHGLGALYLGFSVAFGHGLIRWADVRFAHRFAGGPAPVRPDLFGSAHMKREWVEFGKAILAGAISVALLEAAIVIVGDSARTAALDEWIGRVGFVLAIWAIWPVSYTLWPRRERDPMSSAVK